MAANFGNDVVDRVNVVKENMENRVAEKERALALYQLSTLINRLAPPKKAGILSFSIKGRDVSEELTLKNLIAFKKAYLEFNDFLNKPLPTNMTPADVQNYNKEFQNRFKALDVACKPGMRRVIQNSARIYGRDLGSLITFVGSLRDQISKDKAIVGIVGEPRQPLAPKPANR